MSTRLGYSRSSLLLMILLLVASSLGTFVLAAEAEPSPGCSNDPNSSNYCPPQSLPPPCPRPQCFHTNGARVVEQQSASLP
uniref:Uncharacterized protein n=1 Tax=Oryza rufipogon TaxID=4529 RepID=A0A0E0RB34_ORYRU